MPVRSPSLIRRTFAAVATGLVVAALGGCSGRTELLPAEPQPLPARVTLAPGGTATFGVNGALRVTFREIEADSRCPVDAQCVWAGDAAVLLRLERGGLRAGTTLHTYLAPQRVIFDEDFAIRLVDATPAPRAEVATPAAQYRVTIEVSAP
jgi:hypothetical protein